MQTENEQLRAQLAEYEQDTKTTPDTNTPPQTVEYHGTPVTLGQLHAIYRGMDILPAEHPSKTEVHTLIRKLQKDMGNAVEPEERCAHLETILTRLYTKMETATTKHHSLEAERESIQKKLASAQEEIDDIQVQIDNALEDKKEAEERRTKTMQAKQQQCRTATEGYQEDFKTFLKTHYAQIHQLCEDNLWDVPQKQVRKYEQEFSGHTIHSTALGNVLQHRQPNGLSPHQKKVIVAAKAWYDSKPHLKPAGDIGQLLDAPIPEDVAMGGDNGTCRPPPPNENELPPKKSKRSASAPYIYKEGTNDIELIEVPKDIKYTEDLEKAVFEYNEQAIKSDTEETVPPVPPTYGMHNEDRWKAEFHFAILHRRDEWKHFPPWKEYINARANDGHA